jgi:hypothetical protein
MYWKTIVKRKAKPILEQTVTLYQFVALHYEYITYEELSVDKQQFDKQLINLIALKINVGIEANTLIDPVTLNNMRSFYTQLKKDEQLSTFPQKNAKEPLYNLDNRPVLRLQSLVELSDGITWQDEAFRVDYQYIKFDGYLFADLLKWCKQNYDDFNMSLNEKYLSKGELSDGKFRIDALPKLLRLAVEAHCKFDWENTDLSSLHKQNMFKRTLHEFLVERALALRIPNTSTKENATEFGISDKTEQTFQLIIKPDKDDD